MKKSLLLGVFLGFNLLILARAEAQQNPGTFAASVKGDIQADFNGTASALRYPDGGTVVTMNEAATGRTLVITVPPQAAAGEHPLKSFPDAYKPGRKVVDYGASYSQVGSKSGAKVAGFTEVKEGSVNIDSLEPLSGHFKYSSESKEEGKIRVSGEFRNVSIMKMP